jgi:acyl-coenzyme A synthetase/AMP-(fatty) acid ligase
VGRAVDGVDLRVGEAGKLTATGSGPIWVRSKAVSRVSIGPAAEDEKERKRKKSGEIPIGGFDKEGWFRTGDLGKLDKAGKLALQGREDDVVKVDGKRIALGEVEGCIEGFSKVKAAQALVIQDPLAGPMVVARVVIAGKASAEEIIDHCAKNLASYKVPRRIEFCENLPT